MPNQQPIIEVSRGRKLTMHGAAIVNFIVNQARQFLLVKHPNRDGWEMVSGALDAEETLIEGSQRELHEELGADIQANPLGLIHAYTFRYDDHVQFMISLCFLYEYIGGEIIPSDDMAGGSYQWVSLQDIEAGSVEIIVPHDYQQLFRRVLLLFDSYQQDSDFELQPKQSPDQKNKYGY